MKRTASLLLFFALVASLALPAIADDIVYETVYLDPATLHVGNPPAGGDPNQLSTNSFVVLQNSGGAGTLMNPWLVILGVPNTAVANPFGSGITNLPVYDPKNPGVASWAYSGHAAGTLGAGQEVYTQLGLYGPGVDKSNNFVNWSGAESSIAGINATSFGLYEFRVWDTLSGGDSVTLNFDQLPSGTIAIAWGQTSSTSSSRTCTTTGKKKNCTTTFTTTYTTYDSPFTEAGFKLPPPPVPEPASIALFFSGILGLAGLKRVRR